MKTKQLKPQPFTLIGSKGWKVNIHGDLYGDHQLECCCVAIARKNKDNNVVLINAQGEVKWKRVDNSIA